MQTLEKALHQPMPFTTGGQTITDRLTAARHALAGSQLGKTICKATTEELMAPKKKHLDYLLHCTNEPNVSIPSMANLLIERTQNPNWVVAYKALITIHNIMCYGNERFSQYLASCNTTFNLTNFLDKSNPQGYDMSNHVRRYGKYISEKIYTYRLCAFDFCKIKRGREDGVLRVMHTDKLIKTLPMLQNQMDALLEFQVTAGELNNGVINCSFILLFRDLIRLFACYNDGVINLLEKFFDMNKKQAREALDLYKSFLLRLDKVAAFLSVAESVGVDRGEIPDLTRAPASLIEALETHLYHLEGGKGPLPSSSQQFVTQQLQQAQQPSNIFNPVTANIDPSMRQRYLEEEKERLRLYEEQRQQQMGQQQQSNVFNPFAQQPQQVPQVPQMPQQVSQFQQHSGNDPPLMFTQPQQNPNAIPHSDLLELYKQPPAIEPTNPFAAFIQQPPQAPYVGFSQPMQRQAFPPPSYSTGILNGPPIASTSKNNGFKDYPQAPPPVPPQPQFAQAAFNPFAMAPTPAPPQPGGVNPFAAAPGYGVPPQEPQVPVYNQQPPVPPAPAPAPVSQPMAIPQAGQNLGIYDQTPFSGADSSYTAPSQFQQQMEQQNSVPGVPPGGVSVPGVPPTMPPAPGGNLPPGVPPAPGGPPRPPPPANQTAQPVPAAGTFDPFANASMTNPQGKSTDIDSTLSNLVNNMEIAGKNPAWMAPGAPATPGNNAGWPQNQQGQAYGNSGYPPQPSTQANQNPFNPFG
ncbi:hypothetical protein FO519_002710 [Halicephalobus sp. NKZ332]|nr:hypothetical protein FO519_002710 [Halicephalobus sp. NKZ332]